MDGPNEPVTNPFLRPGKLFGGKLVLFNKVLFNNNVCCELLFMEGSIFIRNLFVGITDQSQLCQVSLSPSHNIEFCYVSLVLCNCASRRSRHGKVLTRSGTLSLSLISCASVLSVLFLSVRSSHV